MNINIQKLLTKKITRKQFLMFLGLAGITILGIPQIFKSISNLNPNKDKKQSNKIEAKSLFGSGAYGV